MKEEIRRPVAFEQAGSNTASFTAIAVGALAFGALAIGALAIGRLVIGQLAVRKMRLHAVEIDNLTVRRLRVLESAGASIGNVEPLRLSPQKDA